MSRGPALILAGALAVCLIAGSPTRLVGDGREYLAQALEFASLHGPAFRPSDIPHVQGELAQFDPALANWDIWSSTIGDVDRGRVFLHFWFYALLAAPGVWLANVLGAPPTFGFTALNLLLFGGALWVAFPRVGPAACVLLFGGPIVWWLDKAHTEVFTFALLTIALALMRDRPWWAMVAAAMASTQNPPIAILVAIVVVSTVVRDRSALADGRVIAAIAVAVALALLHPVYTYAHHGRLSLLLEQTRSGIPTFQTLTAVVLDPSVGLIGNFPVFVIVVVAGLVTLTRTQQSDRYLLSTTVVIPAAVAAIFLFAFSRTTNVHHGGTPSLSRYAVWLIPLAIPLLSALQQNGGRVWHRFLWMAAVLSAVISVFAFRPSVPQNSREPTWLATFLWTRVPALNNPLAEVFIETELHVDEPQLPAVTGGCEKILIAGADLYTGVLPVPCYPAPVPAECQRAGVLCYSNRTGGGYEFVPVRDAATFAARVRRDTVWPDDVVGHVRQLYEAWNWRNMRAGSFNVVRAVENVSIESLGSNERFILVLRNPRAGAVVRLRPTSPLDGILVDALSGRTIRSVHYNGEPGMMTVDLPYDSQILLLAIRAERSR
jgi:hypothetical protein